MGADKLLENKIYSIYISIMNESERNAEIQEIIKGYKLETGYKAQRGNKYTKKFIKWNKEKIKEGITSIIAHDPNKLYDPITNRFINRKSILTNKGTFRKKYQNSPYYKINNQVFTDANKYLNKIKPQIINAEQKQINKDIKIDFNLLNDDLSLLLNILKPTTKRYQLTTQLDGTKKIFMLNNNTIQALQKLLKKGEVITYEVDIDSLRTIVLSWQLRQPFTLTIMGDPPKKTQGNVGFFGYNHNLDKIDLSRYGIYTKKQEEDNDDLYDINCICQCLINSDIDITSIKHLIKNRHIPQKDLKVVAETLNIYITLRYIKDEKKKNHYGDKNNKEIKIGNINNHAFLIEPVNYTTYSIKNYHEIKDEKDFNKIYTKEGKRYKRKKDRFTDSYNLIKILFENKDIFLTDIKYHENLYKSIYHEKVNEFGSLDYDPEVNAKLNEPREPNNNINIKTIFFDYETTTSNDDKTFTKHKPYCVYTDYHPEGFWGEDCGRLMLNELCDKYGTDKDDEDEMKLVKKHKKHVTLIAHNAGYDFRFLLKHLFYGLSTIEKNNGLMSGKSLYYYKNKCISLNIRDSLKLINMPLSKFGECFNLETEKEIMPYDLYTEENVKKRYVALKDCLYEVKKAKLDCKTYMKNLKKWSCLHHDLVDIHKYAGEYCYMDCLTLRDGYNKFSELVKEGTNQDISSYISLASMANDYLLSQGCYEDVYMLSGVPRHFIQKCVVGGRTMTCENKKHKKLKCEISDFDAVSLYPSAMTRMRGFLKGQPKVIKTFEPSKYDGYFIQIKITELNKQYKFPLASLMTDKGVRNFTNDLINRVIFVDRTMLEDLIKFSDIKYEFIKGYYYDEGHNAKIKKVMAHLFKQRVKFKKLKNPIQMVFKELMNSSYGKTFMKPIDSDKEYISVKSLSKYIDYNYNNIKSITLCDNEKMYRVEKIKSIDTHFNNVPCGVEILSMSKRIMNEVMTLAEDNKFNMYITDTDSIHIDTDKVAKLGELFNKKYDRVLIGKGMGQFHTDFEMSKDLLKDEDDYFSEPVAISSIFLGKKCYADKLKAYNRDGEAVYDYHYRMKGVPSDCIKYKADKDFNGDIIKLYEKLYDDPNGMEFNLLACRPKFEFHSDMTISSKSKFMRRLKFL
jgi:hypothetical protein